MRAKFIGDPRDNFSGPPSVTVSGVTFPKDKWVASVPVKVFEKLQTNGHFETDGAKQVTSEAAAREVVDDTPEPVAEDTSTAGDDHRVQRRRAEDEVAATLAEETKHANAAGAPAPAEPAAEPAPSADDAERTAVKAELDKLGVKYHHNAGLPKLKEALETAKFEAGDDD